MTAALAATQWAVLDAVRARAAHDEQARTIVEQLEYSARHDQNAADLVAALRTAVDAATKLIVTLPPTGMPTGGGQAGTGQRGTDTGQPPVGAGQPPSGTGESGAGTGQPRRRRVTSVTELDEVTRQIRGELDAGRAVTVTWEAQ